MPDADLPGAEALDVTALDVVAAGGGGSLADFSQEDQLALQQAMEQKTTVRRDDFKRTQVRRHHGQHDRAKSEELICDSVQTGGAVAVLRVREKRPHLEPREEQLR